MCKEKFNLILNSLKENLILILLIILTISIFKIAFFGIETYSTIDGNTSTDVTGTVDINNSPQNPIFVERY